VQSIGHRGRLIAYSLGNFVGYHTLADGAVLSESAILRVRLDASRHVLAADWIPITLVAGLPRRDPTTATLVATLSRDDFPADHFDISSTGVFLRLGAPTQRKESAWRESTRGLQHCIPRDGRRRTRASGRL
jgi:hypothetical protein